jgi:hypothetical protein
LSDDTDWAEEFNTGNAGVGVTTEKLGTDATDFAVADADVTNLDEAGGDA